MYFIGEETRQISRRHSGGGSEPKVQRPRRTNFGSGGKKQTLSRANAISRTLRKPKKTFFPRQVPLLETNSSPTTRGPPTVGFNRIVGFFFDVSQHGKQKNYEMKALREINESFQTDKKKKKLAFSQRLQSNCFQPKEEQLINEFVITCRSALSPHPSNGFSLASFFGRNDCAVYLRRR